MTAFVGLLGYPVRHSVSPAFQQAALDHCGLDIRYEAWEVEPDRLAEAVARLRTPDHLGVNVTVPHKEAVMPLLDEVDERAQRIGAVNTVVRRGDRLVGYNTDAGAFMRALRETGFEPFGRRAAILGAGGSAKAVGYALLEANIARLTILNRTLGRADALKSYLKQQSMFLGREGMEIAVGPLDEGAGDMLSACDLLVNCTSVGMLHGPGEGCSPIAEAIIPERAFVYDLVYNPPSTPLLQAARRRGATILNGLPMLVYQGAAAFEMWTGREAPVDIMFAVARKVLEE